MIKSGGGVLVKGLAVAGGWLEGAILVKGFSVAGGWLEGAPLVKGFGVVGGWLEGATLVGVGTAGGMKSRLERTARSCC